MTMLRTYTIRRLVTAACAGSALASVAPAALASGPLEYPDNGASAFSRGGAWLATGTDPIAAHYNPAAMATQGSGFSLDLLFAYQEVCYRRRGAGNTPAGPLQGPSEEATGLQYATVCNSGTTQPRILPSVGMVWRATDQLALGFAVVPPATYGTGPGEFPAVAEGRNAAGEKVRMPAPYRFLTVGNRSTIIHPTFSVGYEILKGLRVGAGFIWSLAVIDVESFGTRTTFADQKGDIADYDTRSRLRTKDMFVPGAVVAIHASPISTLDVAVWARWLDAIDTSQGTLNLISNYWNDDINAPAPICATKGTECTGQGVRDDYGDDPQDVFKQFRYRATPPEIRAGVRFHVPRNEGELKVGAGGPPTRDPLRDDLFDVELNGSYTMNSTADTITVRFLGNDDGTALVRVNPEGRLPPNADRPTGYKDSYGVRLGGQYNLVQSKFGIRAGTWYETESADPEFLHVAPVPAARGGFGGGLVYRHGSLDISAGYQRHWSSGLDNRGNGGVRANAGTQNDGEDFRVGVDPPGGQAFRSFHFINGGQVTHSANVFALGATYRF
jgi:long-subunit fatty acid transport protein